MPRFFFRAPSTIMKRDDSIRSFQKYAQRRMSGGQGASYGLGGWRQNSLTISAVAQNSAYLTDKIASELYVYLLIAKNILSSSSVLPIYLFNVCKVIFRENPLDAKSTEPIAVEKLERSLCQAVDVFRRI